MLHGRSEIAAFVAEATRASSDFRFEDVSLFTAGSDYANEWIMIGTNDREVEGVPATGRSFRVRGASVGKLDASGRIVENRDYYNLAEMFAQRSLHPAGGPAAACVSALRHRVVRVSAAANTVAGACFGDGVQVVAVSRFGYVRRRCTTPGAVHGTPHTM